MGYTTGGPRGVGAITSPFTPKADMGEILAVLAERGGHLGGITEAERDAISGDSLFAGLTVFTTDNGQVEVYTGSGWHVLDRVAASYTPTLTGMTLGGGGSVTAEVGASGGVFWMTFDITLGSSPGFTDPNISVPSWASHAHLPGTTLLGDLLLIDTSATTLGRWRSSAHQGGSSTTVRILRPNSDGRVLPMTTATDPFTWASGDRITGHLSYPLG